MVLGRGTGTVRAAEREGVETLREQIDYALRLVSWSWIARHCHVQIALIDVLIDAGAALDRNAENALVNGNFAAAEHLLNAAVPAAFAEDARHSERAACRGSELLDPGLSVVLLTDTISCKHSHGSS